MKRIACLCLAIAAAGQTYPQSTFHGNPARTGVYEKPGPAVLTGVKWAFKAGGPIVTSSPIGAIMSSPVVDRGIVYVGSMDGRLYAIQ